MGRMTTRTTRKRIGFNLFEMNTVGHISHGLWIHPANTRHRFNDLDFWTEEAKLLEAGLFDAVFLADVIGTYDGYRAGPESALREAVQIPSNDPLLVVPAMAAVTRHLGFAATFSTTYEPPFAFARRASTLDHLTKGRFAWNVVTSYLPNAARNFGLDDESGTTTATRSPRSTSRCSTSCGRARGTTTPSCATASTASTPTRDPCGTSTTSASTSA